MRIGGCKGRKHERQRLMGTLEMKCRLMICRRGHDGKILGTSSAPVSLRKNFLQLSPLKGYYGSSSDECTSPRRQE